MWPIGAKLVAVMRRPAKSIAPAFTVFVLLGLAVPTGLSAVAVFGADAASATTLCKEAKNPCPAGKEYSVGTEFELEIPSGGKSQFIGEKTFNEANCEAAAPKFKTTKNEGKGKVLFGTWSVMNFSKCTGCTTVKELGVEYRVEIQPTATVGEGKLNLTDNGKGTPKFEFTGCALGISCIFGDKNVTLNVHSGQIIEVPSQKTLEFVSGNPLCGSKALWTVTFVPFKLEKEIYVVAEP